MMNKDEMDLNVPEEAEEAKEANETVKETEASEEAVDLKSTGSVEESETDTKYNDIWNAKAARTEEDSEDTGSVWTVRDGKKDRSKKGLAKELKRVGRIVGVAALAGVVFGGAFKGTEAIADHYTAQKTAAVSTAEAADTSEAEEEPIENRVTPLPKDLIDPESVAEAEKNRQEEEQAKREAEAAEENEAAAEASGNDNFSTANLQDKGELTVAQIAEETMPSMVAITNTGVQAVRDFFSGRVRNYESVSKGSGIIISRTDDELLIATNAHVVDGAKTITVTFVNETSVEGSVRGADSNSDLAVVAVPLSSLDEDTLAQVKVIAIGDSDAMKVGEQVVAIGNALGYGQSVSVGFVSATNRIMETGDDSYSEGLIQTDAAINPGNSGGALLNMKGELIGINSAKYAETSVEGMGFAIPINYAEPLLSDMMAGKSVDEDDSLTWDDFYNEKRRDDAEPYEGGSPYEGQVPDDGNGGYYGDGDIGEFFGNGDLGEIFGNGNFGGLFDYFFGGGNGEAPDADEGQGNAGGSPYGGNEAGGRPDNGGSAEQADDAAYMGIRCYSVTDEIAAYYGVPKGVLVVETVEGGAAEKAGLAAQDIITGLDGRTVDSQETLTSLLQNYKAGDTARLTVERENADGEYSTTEILITFGSRS